MESIYYVMAWACHRRCKHCYEERFRPYVRGALDTVVGILDSFVGVPAYEAITMGHPERMGLAHGWSEEDFNAASRTTLPDGRPYENLCIGCDRFHEQVLGPVLAEARARRDAARGISTAATPRRRTVLINELSPVKD